MVTYYVFMEFCVLHPRLETMLLHQMGPKLKLPIPVTIPSIPFQCCKPVL